MCNNTKNTTNDTISAHIHFGVKTTLTETIIKRVSIVYGYKHQKIYETYKIICCVCLLCRRNASPARLVKNQITTLCVFLVFKVWDFVVVALEKARKKREGKWRWEIVCFALFFGRGFFALFVFIWIDLLSLSLSLYSLSLLT